MEIKFYWIEGIDKVDTPWFLNIENQKSYFDKLYKYSIITNAFYPPHTTIELKVDTDDVDFKTSTNYISIEYNDITYYYFINSYKYVNEGIIAFNLSMDTIQTYYFYTQELQGMLDRMTMTKNPNLSTYVKENPSQSQVYVPYITYNDIMWSNITVDIIQCYPGENTTLSKSQNYGYELPYTIVLKPYCNGEPMQKINFGNSQIINVSDVDYLYKSGYVVKIFGGIPLNYIHKNWTISLDGMTLNINNGDSAGSYMSVLTKNYNNVEKKLLSMYLINYDEIFAKNKYTITVPFTKSPGKTYPRTELYYPYLLHNNCFRVKYGEVGNLKVAEFSKYSGESIDLHYGFNIETGERIYYINDIDNPYGDIQYCTSTTEISLATTESIQYNETNSISRYTGYAISALTAATAVLTDRPSGILDGVSGAISLASKQGDIANSPGKVMQSSSALSTMVGNYIKPYVVIEQVEDIRGCMNYLEQYGLKANFNHSIGDLALVQTRYYYNYIKYTDVHTTFTCLISNQIKEDFESRLKNGIRLWNVSSGITIGNTSYDNAER